MGLDGSMVDIRQHCLDYLFVINKILMYQFLNHNGSKLVCLYCHM
jgi:hypothetical protein